MWALILKSFSAQDQSNAESVSGWFVAVGRFFVCVWFGLLLMGKDKSHCIDKSADYVLPKYVGEGHHAKSFTTKYLIGALTVNLASFHLL